MMDLDNAITGIRTAVFRLAYGPCIDDVTIDFPVFFFTENDLVIGDVCMSHQ